MDVFELAGRNLYWIRREAGLSQEAVGIRMGIDRAHVNAIENGRQNITFATFQHLCIALDRRPAEFFDESRPPKPEPARSGARAKRRAQPARRTRAKT